jgi:tetratricopeptide (TPR) repeat protein
MILAAFLAATASLLATQGGDAARVRACAELTKSDPVRAVTEAEAWNAAGPSVASRQCLGLAYVATQRWTQAVTALEDAATLAESQQDGRAGGLWSQAGNAALAGDNPTRARTNLDRAITAPGMSQFMRGEAFIDRSRADVALNELSVARSDLDQGTRMVPADPFGWLLSATLARREKNLTRAEKDIGEALRLAPDDAAVALEAGNIAAAQGAVDAARLAWEKAVELAPKEPAGQAAAAALSANR